MAPSGEESLPQRPLAFGLKVLNTRCALVHQFRVFSPEEEHPQFVDLLEDTLELSNRRTGLARRSQTMHLKHGVASFGHLSDLLVRRIRVLAVANPGEHPQIVDPWGGDPVGRYTDPHAK